MKKVIAIFTIVTTLVACGGSTSTEVTTDSTVVAVDSTVATPDTVVAQKPDTAVVK